MDGVTNSYFAAAVDLRANVSADTPDLDQSGTRILHLSPFDQTIGRIYVRKLFCFEFPDSERQLEAIEALHHGIAVAVARWPFLTGSVGPAKNSPRRNAVDLTYTTDHDGEPVKDILVIKSLSVEEFPWTYQQLKDAGMPPSAMQKEKLCAVPEHPRAGETRPAFSVQASFFEGGLILCVASHHTVFDGNSVKQFLKAFATALKTFQRADSIKEVSFPRRLEYSEGMCEDCRGSCLDVLPEFDTRKPTIIEIDTNVRKQTTARILSFSATKVEGLKASVTQQLPLVAEIGAWVSTTDCIAALVWIAVVRARQHRLEPSTEVKFGTAVDIRSKADPPLAPEYFGNAIVHTLTKATVAELTNTMDHDSGIDVTELSTTNSHDSGTDVAADEDSNIDLKSIALAASRIRAAILRVNSAYVQERLRVFSNVADPTFAAMAYKKALDMPNTGLDMSSWQDQGADFDFAIPGASAHPEFVRKTYSANEGAFNILPRRGGSKGVADWEILLGLSVADMEGVCCKAELGAWYTKWVE